MLENDAARATRPRSVVLGASLVLNAAALVLALVVLTPKDTLVAERFEIVDSDGVSAGWFATTAEGAELVFRHGIDGRGARFVVDLHSARFETLDEAGQVVVGMVADLDNAAIELDNGDDARVRLEANREGSRLTLIGANGSIKLDANEHGQAITLQHLAGGAAEGQVEIKVDRERSIIRATYGERVAELGADEVRSWIRSDDGRSRSNVLMSTGEEGATVRLSQLDSEAALSGDVVAPARTLTLAATRLDAGIRLDTPTRTLRWPPPEGAP